MRGRSQRIHIVRESVRPGLAVAQQDVAVRGQDGLGVELNSLYIEVPVAYSHDDAVFCLGCYIEVIRNRIWFNSERVISDCFKRLR